MEKVAKVTVGGRLGPDWEEQAKQRLDEILPEGYGYVLIVVPGRGQRVGSMGVLCANRLSVQDVGELLEGVVRGMAWLGGPGPEDEGGPEGGETLQ